MRRSLLLLAVLLCFAVPGRSQWPYIPARQSESTALNAASITCTTDGPVQSGNLEVVFFSWFSSTNTPTVSNTLGGGGTWTQALLNTSNAQKVAVYTSPAIGTAIDVITVAETSGQFMNITCVEIPAGIGTATVDASAVSTYSGTPATVTSPSITTTLNNDLVFAFFANNNSTGGQGLQASDNGTWVQLGVVGGADSQSTFMRVGGAAAAGNTVTVDNKGTSGTSVSIAFKSAGLAITSAPNAPDGATSNAYDWTVLAAGGNAALTWSVPSGALPTGLSMNSSTGRITGTPTVSNSYTANIQVTDGTTTVSAPISFKIGTSLNTIAALQVKGIGSGTGAANLAFTTANVTAGSLILVNTANVATKSQLAPCTDTLGTPFTLLGRIQWSPATVTTANVLGGIDTYAGFAPSGGADTVTCPGGNFIVSMGEFSNVQYFANDNMGFTRGATANPATITSNSLTTLVPNELLWAVSQGYTSTTTNTASGSFTGVGTALTSTAAYQVVSTVTGYTASFSQTGNTNTSWQMSMAGFRPSAGAISYPGTKCPCH